MWRRIRKIEEGNSQNMKEIIDRTKNTAEKNGKRPFIIYCGR